MLVKSEMLLDYTLVELCFVGNLHVNIVRSEGTDKLLETGLKKVTLYITTQCKTGITATIILLRKKHIFLVGRLWLMRQIFWDNFVLHHRPVWHIYAEIWFFIFSDTSKSYIEH